MRLTEKTANRLIASIEELNKTLDQVIGKTTSNKRNSHNRQRGKKQSHRYIQWNQGPEQGIQGLQVVIEALKELGAVSHMNACPRERLLARVNIITQGHMSLRQLRSIVSRSRNPDMLSSYPQEVILSGPKGNYFPREDPEGYNEDMQVCVNWLRKISSGSNPFIDLIREQSSGIES